ncbi:THAP domain-containing protein 1-like isoform X2 [Ostrinia furnacalis]|uniref:THAP domain-containing protein 1-like isoform X2 n=1 Tax=Ostrinia furnacalis TaxID=93504 RepID=UPI00103DECDA|nr:THAP domain-containing protein 1-like isoform X2 [Ostrinia furnacalis]
MSCRCLQSTRVCCCMRTAAKTRKMPQCVIINCNKPKISSSQRQGHNISYHGFPQDAILKEKWIAATGRKDWFPTKHSTICSIHFESTCFIDPSKKKRLLKKTSCPTIHILKRIDNDDEVINGGIIKREPEPEPLDDPDELWDNPGSEEERLSELPKTTDTCVDSIDFDYEQYKRPAPSTSSNSPKRMRSESLLAESLKEVSTNLAGLKEDAAKNQHMTKEELHDNFGRYVASLMRLLPMKKALMLQPKIVNMISSEILDCQDDIFD